MHYGPIPREPHPPPPPPQSRLLKEAEKTPDEDSCTEENWKSFYSYKKKDYRGAAGRDCDPDEFDQVLSSSSKSLSLMKDQNQIHLSIHSSFLQEQLRKVLNIEHFNGVRISASEIVLEQPFGPLYHHVEEMRSTVETDPEATTEDRACMNALYYFATLGWPASLYKDLRSKISRGFIFYDDIWALFKPGDFAVIEDLSGTYSVSKIEAVKLEREDRAGMNHVYRWYISLKKITCKSGRFRKIVSRRRIELFAGAKRINELEFYPLSHHAAVDEVRRVAIQGGEAWKRFFEGEARVMAYHGEAIPVIGKETKPVGMYAPPVFYSDPSKTIAATASLNSINHGFVLIHNRYLPQLSLTRELRLKRLHKPISTGRLESSIIHFTMMVLLLVPKSVISPRKTS